MRHDLVRMPGEAGGTEVAREEPSDPDHDSGGEQRGREDRERAAGLAAGAWDSAHRVDRPSSLDLGEP